MTSEKGVAYIKMFSSLLKVIPVLMSPYWNFFAPCIFGKFQVWQWITFS